MLAPCRPTCGPSCWPLGPTEGVTWHQSGAKQGHAWPDARRPPMSKVLRVGSQWGLRVHDILRFIVFGGEQGGRGGALHGSEKLSRGPWGRRYGVVHSENKQRKHVLRIGSSSACVEASPSASGEAAVHAWRQRQCMRRSSRARAEQSSEQGQGEQIIASKQQ